MPRLKSDRADVTNQQLSQKEDEREQTERVQERWERIPQYRKAAGQAKIRRPSVDCGNTA